MNNEYDENDSYEYDEETKKETEQKTDSVNEPKDSKDTGSQDGQQYSNNNNGYNQNNQQYSNNNNGYNQNNQQYYNNNGYNQNNQQYYNNNNGYNQNGQQYYSYQGPRYDANGKIIGNGFGIAALILGIISLLMFCTFINILPAVLAIVFGLIQITRYNQKGMAIAGIVTGAVSIVLLICFWTLVFTGTAYDSVRRDVENSLNNDTLFDEDSWYNDDDTDASFDSYTKTIENDLNSGFQMDNIQISLDDSKSL